MKKGLHLSGRKTLEAISKMALEMKRLDDD
jgi:hypothetical protein